VADDKLTRGLGLLSLGLSIPALLMPRKFGQALGIGDAPRHQATAVVVGGQELAAAVGLLGQESPGWLWYRVGGDLMHIGMLGRALKNHDERGLERTVAAFAAVLGITGVDVYAAVTRSRRKVEMDMTATTTVGLPEQEVYEMWRRLGNLPKVIAHRGDVGPDGTGRSHWRTGAPSGRTAEWDAEITEDVPGQRIAWRSVGSADIGNEGSVQFVPAPGGRGTEVHVKLRYEMPGGKLGEAVARYFGEDPHQQLDDYLRRFKQVAETGEVVRSEGAPGGKRARREFSQHPARSLNRDELAQEAQA
jgi:uncharacterized membrane protein